MRSRIRVFVGGLLAGLIVAAGLPGVAEASGATIRLGSRGAYVVALQRDLHIPADGDFGRHTRQAVITFQRRHHLTADGIVGPRTWRALGGVPRTRAPRTVATHRVTAKPAPRRTVATSLRSRAVAIAAAQRGKRYVWGAAGPNTFDCSGLVQWVYGRVGVSLPRTTWAQYAILRHISHAALQPGDLVFVDNLQHVGIYAGYGQIWHAPHTGDHVRMSTVWDPHYLAARV